MWGSKASIHSVKAARESMKWHLVNEKSLEERSIEVGWGQYKKTALRTYGYLDCGRKGYDHTRYSFDYKLPLVLRETVNLYQANICTYCKKARMKELGIDTKVEA